VVGPFLSEIDGLAKSFYFFCIRHVKRVANMRAHPCARLACTQELFLASSLHAVKAIV
jgi:hypothetical protein